MKDCVDCGHPFGGHDAGGCLCSDGIHEPVRRCPCKRFNDGSSKPLSLYTRAEVVEMIREATAPQNRYARVDAAVKRVEDEAQFVSSTVFDELRAAIHAERGTR